MKFTGGRYREIMVRQLIPFPEKLCQLLELEIGNMLDLFSFFFFGPRHAGSLWFKEIVRAYKSTDTNKASFLVMTIKDSE